MIFGVDIAHGGGDKTKFIDRQGRKLGHYLNEEIDEDDEMTITGHLVAHIDNLKPDMVFVDITGGYGAGVVDRLKEQGYSNMNTPTAISPSSTARAAWPSLSQTERPRRKPKERPREPLRRDQGLWI